MKSIVQGRSGRGRTRPIVAGLLAAASVAGAVGVAAAAQGDVNDLRAVGPVPPRTGTRSGIGTWMGPRSSVCLDGTPLCRFLPGDVPNPGAAISFPDNFPGEAFWWAGESVIADGATKKVVLVMAAEAASRLEVANAASAAITNTTFLVAPSAMTDSPAHQNASPGKLSGNEIAAPGFGTSPGKNRHNGVPSRHNSTSVPSASRYQIGYPFWVEIGPTARRSFTSPWAAAATPTAPATDAAASKPAMIGRVRPRPLLPCTMLFISAS